MDPSVLNPDPTRDVAQWLRARFFGKYRGVVTDNRDPSSQGRLQVQVPAVLGELTLWAMPCVPYAGDGVGLHLLPDVGTGVWIDFEGGDPSYPVWTGCFWGSGQLPDPGGPGIKILRTATATIRIDDDAGEVRIATDAGTTVTLSDRLTVEAGGATFEVGAAGITSELGAGKLAVGPGTVAVNDGALQVV